MTLLSSSGLDEIVDHMNPTVASLERMRAVTGADLPEFKATLQAAIDAGEPVAPEVILHYGLTPPTPIQIDPDECQESRPRGAFSSLAAEVAQQDADYQSILYVALKRHGQPSTWSDLVYAYQHVMLTAVLMSTGWSPEQQARLAQLKYFPPIIDEWNEKQKTGGVTVAMPTEFARILQAGAEEMERRRRSGQQGGAQGLGKAAEQLADEAGLGVFAAPGAYEPEPEVERFKGFVRFPLTRGMVAIDPYAVDAVLPFGLSLDQKPITRVVIGARQVDVQAEFEDVVRTLEAAR